MKTIIVGLGNPILGDDGVGWKVAEEVKKQLTSPLPGLRHPSPTGRLRHMRRHAVQVSAPQGGAAGEGVDIEFLSLGGISLMEQLIGYERAILIDAVISDRKVGSVIVCRLDEIPETSAFHITSAHDTSLQNALKLGKAMGADLPEQVTVVGIVAQHTLEFCEELSAPVTQAIPQAAQIVIHLL